MRQPPSEGRLSAKLNVDVAERFTVPDSKDDGFAGLGDHKCGPGLSRNEGYLLPLEAVE